MDKEKKKWETPRLICLYRGRPEETVLTICKGSAAEGPDAYGCPDLAPPPPDCKVLNTT